MYEGNILFVKDGSPEGSMSSRWLCSWPAAALRDAGYFIDEINYQDVPSMSRGQQRASAWADIIIYERHIDDPWLPYLEKWAKEKRLFLTLDDAYWAVAPTTTTYAFWSQNGRLEKLERVAGWAEGVIVPSKKLAEHFQNGIFKPNRPNFLDPAWSISPLFSEKVVMWGGTQGHISGMEGHPAVEAMKQLSQEGEAQLVAITGDPLLRKVLGEIPGTAFTPIQPYNEWLRFFSGATVVICPIGPGYDQYRSWIKALEAAAVGAPWIASDSGVYDGAQGGILVKDTVEAWKEAIMSILDDVEFRDGLMEEGRKWAWKQGVHEHLDEWEAIFSG